MTVFLVGDPFKIVNVIVLFVVIDVVHIPFPIGIRYKSFGNDSVNHVMSFIYCKLHVTFGCQIGDFTSSKFHPSMGRTIDW